MENGVNWRDYSEKIGENIRKVGKLERKKTLTDQVQLQSLYNIIIEIINIVSQTQSKQRKDHGMNARHKEEFLVNFTLNRETCKKDQDTLTMILKCRKEKIHQSF